MYNMRSFIQEVLTAFVEAPFKSTDVPAVVKLVSLICRRHVDFGPKLIPELVHAFQKASELGDERKGTLAGCLTYLILVVTLRRRMLMRLLGELYIVGIFNDFSIIINMVRELAKKDHAVANLTLVTAFVRTFAEELIGIEPDTARPV